MNLVGDLKVYARINREEHFYDVLNIEEGKKLIDYLSNSDSVNSAIGFKSFGMIVCEGLDDYGKCRWGEWHIVRLKWE